MTLVHVRAIENGENAECLRHKEIDVLELAEVIGTPLELDLDSLPRWPEVRQKGTVRKYDTPRLSCIPSQMFRYHTQLHGQFGGAKRETGPCYGP